MSHPLFRVTTWIVIIRPVRTISRKGPMPGGDVVSKLASLAVLAVGILRGHMQSSLYEAEG